MTDIADPNFSSFFTRLLGEVIDEYNEAHRLRGLAIDNARHAQAREVPSLLAEVHKLTLRCERASAKLDTLNTIKVGLKTHVGLQPSSA